MPGCPYFYLLAKSAEEHLIVLDEVVSSYATSMAFSIEMFLKSLNATTEYVEALEIGSVKVFRPVSKGPTGHDFEILWKKVNQSKKEILRSQYEDFRWKNMHANSLDENIKDLSNSFTESRYYYEKGIQDTDQAIELGYFAKFFYENLSPDSEPRHNWE